MIITRSPLRVSLGGGGTDLESYYSRHGGYILAASIDKYVFVTINRPFTEGIYLKYSNIEKASVTSEIKHPIIREAINLLNPKTPQLEITTLADIPAGTGLGSSGSFTTALLKALFAHYRKSINQNELAELACEIEINRLKEPIGKQDQYIAAYGGITEFEISPSGVVRAFPLDVPIKTVHDLEDNLVLFYTGISRSASIILKDQDQKSHSSDSHMIENLHAIKEMGYKSRDALKSGRTLDFAELMNEHWRRKRERSTGISNDFVDEVYEAGLRSGAVGGKLVGAGGGGFLMFYASDAEKLRSAIAKFNLEEVRFKFDFEGSKVVLS